MAGILSLRPKPRCAVRFKPPPAVVGGVFFRWGGPGSLAADAPSLTLFNLGRRMWFECSMAERVYFGGRVCCPFEDVCLRELASRRRSLSARSSSTGFIQPPQPRLASFEVSTHYSHGLDSTMVCPLYKKLSLTTSR